MKHCFLLLLLGALGFIRHAAGRPGPPAKEKTSAYLFVYFTGNDIKEEAIRFALSPDGYHYTAFNGNRPVISSATISETGGVRDPHILRGADGKTFYMVATDMVSAKGWDSNRGIVLMKSTDLITWKSSAINFQKRYPGQENLKRVWAPQTIYDAQAGKYLVYFSLKHGTDPDKIYYAYANKDFTDLEGEPKQLFVSPTNGSCIDGDIVAKDGKFYLFFKTEGQGNGIKIAVSDKLTGGYVLRDQYVQKTTDPVEGAGTFKLNNSNDYILMYDVYTKGRYQFTRTSDLRNFKVVDGEVSMDFHPRHGTVLPITAQEGARLAARWLAPAAVLRSARNPAIRAQNTVADSAAGKLSFLAKPNTNLKAFDPAFSTFAGVTVQPAGPQDFTKGPVRYTVSGTNQKQSVSLSITETHNPALAGYYADPAILYSEKTGKFYLYPTSDGFTGWSGTYFKAFSSPDLVNWKDEGVILDLGKDVSWAKKNAWAPCIIEQKTATGYKYAYYFCAEAKIGVALADSPTGPFMDSGKPLIDTRPEGAKGGQQIDPAVFHDPHGKNYLYWGNGYLAGAELNDDLTSLKPGTTQVLTPDGTFREGTHVLYRNGTYYFMWSENDTRDPDYRVRYGTATSPLGKIMVPANNLVVSKDAAAGLYGTGHNSTIQVPGRDEWYLVYHRFTYPQGITMGRAAGYHREVCIDKLEFNADGSIQPVTPTHVGIPPVRVK
ncbi:family 43 glycosylhydrolase [Microvirga sp. STS02]|uniref:family 43 glycosylhydrolase n=1 Tax=Hymenobacter negativus TaxID=2795026 RepID=UPI0018DE359F|nr:MULTISPECIES: family 43 glycosylhydrolase [Bacteria]MBH8568608.1 family 43 glycosylhydrolase [Hymenobacter negativus]MBR7208342.1 family 43 glycosylhydrolase [Microvirga sp. STS02]